MKITTKLWIGIGFLIFLSPSGLLLPEYFKAGSAWGEWDAQKIQGLIGYIPRGLEKFSSFWRAPAPDYSLNGLENKGLTTLSFIYIISAIIGVLAVAMVVYWLAKFLLKDEK